MSKMPAGQPVGGKTVERKCVSLSIKGKVELPTRVDKGAIWIDAKAWDRVDKDTLKHSWLNLWAESLFFDEEPDFTGFRVGTI
jgi:hypothetical protein